MHCTCWEVLARFFIHCLFMNHLRETCMFCGMVGVEISTLWHSGSHCFGAGLNNEWPLYLDPFICAFESLLVQRSTVEGKLTFCTGCDFNVGLYTLPELNDQIIVTFGVSKIYFYLNWSKVTVKTFISNNLDFKYCMLFILYISKTFNNFHKNVKQYQYTHTHTLFIK